MCENYRDSRSVKKQTSGCSEHDKRGKKRNNVDVVENSEKKSRLEKGCNDALKQCKLLVDVSNWLDVMMTLQCNVGNNIFV